MSLKSPCSRLEQKRYCKLASCWQPTYGSLSPPPHPLHAFCSPIFNGRRHLNITHFVDLDAIWRPMALISLLMQFEILLKGYSLSRVLIALVDLAKNSCLTQRSVFHFFCPFLLARMESFFPTNRHRYLDCMFHSAK